VRGPPPPRHTHRNRPAAPPRTCKSRRRRWHRSTRKRQQRRRRRRRRQWRWRRRSGEHAARECGRAGAGQRRQWGERLFLRLWLGGGAVEPRNGGRWEGQRRCGRWRWRRRAALSVMWLPQRRARCGRPCEDGGGGAGWGRHSPPPGVHVSGPLSAVTRRRVSTWAKRASRGVRAARSVGSYSLPTTRAPRAGPAA